MFLAHGAGSITKYEHAMNQPSTEKDPVAAAEAAGLHYVSDTEAGIERRKRGKSFRYLAPDGTTLDDEKHLARIKALAIPPAWTNVWISPDPLGHLQATGRDARGRKQYRYHALWREARDMSKYERMLAFGAALPAIRAQVAKDLARSGLPRPKVLATVVRLLETTFIRIGNAEYAAHNKTYGLTTLRNRHVKIQGSRVRFKFRGKSGVHHTIDINDRKLARVIQQCRDMSGELFTYLDEQGIQRDVSSEDVNAYLREITGQDWTAKDFRTWAGTVLAAMALQACGIENTKTRANKNLVAAVQAVAEQLGNTPAVCRKAYIHPAVLDSYLDGSLLERLEKAAHTLAPDLTLRPEEQAILNLLHSLEG